MLALSPGPRHASLLVHEAKTDYMRQMRTLTPSGAMHKHTGGATARGAMTGDTWLANRANNTLITARRPADLDGDLGRSRCASSALKCLICLRPGLEPARGGYVHRLPG
jgi:hypothetical protein